MFEEKQIMVLDYTSLYYFPMFCQKYYRIIYFYVSLLTTQYSKIMSNLKNTFNKPEHKNNYFFARIYMVVYKNKR